MTWWRYELITSGMCVLCAALLLIDFATYYVLLGFWSAAPWLGAVIAVDIYDRRQRR